MSTIYLLEQSVTSPYSAGWNPRCSFLLNPSLLDRTQVPILLLHHIDTVLSAYPRGLICFLRTNRPPSYQFRVLTLTNSLIVVVIPYLKITIYCYDYKPSSQEDYGYYVQVNTPRGRYYSSNRNDFKDLLAMLDSLQQTPDFNPEDYYTAVGMIMPRTKVPAPRMSYIPRVSIYGSYDMQGPGLRPVSPDHSRSANKLMNRPIKRAIPADAKFLDSKDPAFRVARRIYAEK